MVARTPAHGPQRGVLPGDIYAGMRAARMDRILRRLMPRACGLEQAWTGMSNAGVAARRSILLVRMGRGRLSMIE